VPDRDILLKRYPNITYLHKILLPGDGGLVIILYWFKYNLAIVKLLLMYLPINGQNFKFVYICPFICYIDKLQNILILFLKMLIYLQYFLITGIINWSAILSSINVKYYMMRVMRLMWWPKRVSVQLRIILYTYILYNTNIQYFIRNRYVKIILIIYYIFVNVLNFTAL